MSRISNGGSILFCSVSPIVGEKGISYESMKEGVSLCTSHIMKHIFDGEIGLGMELGVKAGGGILVVVVCLSSIVISASAIK